MATIFRGPLVQRIVAVSAIAAGLAQTPPNLLASTLQPTVGVGRDQPNAIAKGFPLENRTYVDASETWLLKDGFFGAAGQPPANLHHPNPQLPTRIPFSDPPNLILSTLQAGTPFVPMAFPNPTLKLWTVRPQSYRPTSAAPIPLVPFPFGSVFDNPILAKYPTIIRGFVHPYDAYVVPATVGTQPFGTYDFPNPIGPRFSVELRTWLGSPQFISGSGAKPFAPIEWPNPTLKAFAIENRTYVDPLNLVAISKDRFFGGDGQPPTFQPPPNPLIGGRASDTRTAVSSSFLTTLNTAVQAPFRNYDQPNPKGAASPLSNRTFIGYYVGDDNAPFVISDWPNPRTAGYPLENRTWLQAFGVQLTGVDQLPFRLNEQPNPRIRGRSIDLGTFLQMLDLETAGKDALPFFLTDQPVPKGYRFPLELRTFLETPPNISGGVPFVPVEFPNPFIRVPGIELKTQTHAHLPIHFVAPVFGGSVLGPVQTRFDNPVRAPWQLYPIPSNVLALAQSFVVGPGAHVYALIASESIVWTLRASTSTPIALLASRSDTWTLVGNE